MSNTQTTNEQKAVVIAKWNGDKLKYPNLAFIHTKDGAIVPPINIAHITKYYLTDLNYLVPVAVKVKDEISKVVDPFNNEDVGLDIFGNLDREYSNLTKTPEGTYQPLFDAVYNAIVYLENIEQ